MCEDVNSWRITKLFLNVSLMYCLATIIHKDDVKDRIVLFQEVTDGPENIDFFIVSWDNDAYTWSIGCGQFWVGRAVAHCVSRAT